MLYGNINGEGNNKNKTNYKNKSSYFCLLFCHSFPFGNVTLSLLEVDPMP